MHLHIPNYRVYKSLVDIMIKIMMTPHEMTNNLNHSFWKFKITFKSLLKWILAWKESCRILNFEQLSCSNFFEFPWKFLRKLWVKNVDLSSLSTSPFLSPSLSLAPGQGLQSRAAMLPLPLLHCRGATASCHHAETPARPWVPLHCRARA